MAAVLDREVVTMVSTLACAYADGVIDSLPTVESEQALHDGLAGAFMSFLTDVLIAMEVPTCPKTGMPVA